MSGWFHSHVRPFLSLRELKSLKLIENRMNVLNLRLGGATSGKWSIFGWEG
jgi:hypothetical protein